jgi:hypothetical protein
MTLPNFLGIGAQRSGTTWLYTQLRAHPQVYVPSQRKEIHFFDWNYGRGKQWYEHWFPFVPPSDCRAIGEITPEYLFDEVAPARIAETLQDPLFVALLRHPVDRAYSQYCLRSQRMGEARSFEQFYLERPDVRGRSLYAKCLQRFLEHFPKDRFLLLVYEDVMSCPAPAMRELARFLGIDEHGFDPQLFAPRIHSTTQRMHFPGAFSRLRQIGKTLERFELDRLKNALSRTALQLFRKNEEIPRLDPGLRSELMEEFRGDISELERRWSLDVSAWSV